MVSAVIKYVMHLAKFAKANNEVSLKEQSSFGKSGLVWGNFVRTVTPKWPVSETSSTI